MRTTDDATLTPTSLVALAFPPFVADDDDDDDNDDNDDDYDYDYDDNNEVSATTTR